MPHSAKKRSFVQFLYGPYTDVLEGHLNEWDEEIKIIVDAILHHWAMKDEFLRMHEIKRAIGWLWPKLRETAVVGQFSFSTTIDNHTLCSFIFCWNDHAHPEDIRQVDLVLSLFLRKMTQLGVEIDPIVITQQSDARPTAPRQYGPRLDTLAKLEELLSERQKAITADQVALNREQACELTGISRSTWKKYAPTLYDRWYDPAYQGAIH